MSKERRTTTPEEREEASKEARKRVRRKVNTDNEGPVQDRVKEIAARKAEEPLAKDKNKDEKDNKKKKTISIEELAKRSNEFDRKVADAKKKGIPSKDKELGKEKEDKEKDNKEMTPEKQEAKMKEMFAKIKLPSGMEIHQEGPAWKLVSKDGHRTDITDVMNKIDKDNHNIDAANEANRVQNETQSRTDQVTANANQVPSDIASKDVTQDTYNKAVVTVENKLDVNGNQLFKPEDIKTVAETALSFSDEKAKLEDLKALEELQERDKRNKNKDGTERQPEANNRQEANRQAALARSRELSGRGGGR